MAPPIASTFQQAEGLWPVWWIVVKGCSFPGSFAEPVNQCMVCTDMYLYVYTYKIKTYIYIHTHIFYISVLYIYLHRSTYKYIYIRFNGFCRVKNGWSVFFSLDFVAGIHESDESDGDHGCEQT